MNLSFAATIAFAMLVIVGAFLANLVVLVFTASQWHVSGVVLAIVAAAGSYWAQHNFTSAAYALAQHQAAGPVIRDFFAQYERGQALGLAFQIVAIVCLTASVACFWLGMR